MAIPDMKDLVLPVLGAIHGGMRRTVEIRKHLAAKLGLTPQELAERLRSGTTVFANRIAFVLRYSGPAGATVKMEDGSYGLTDFGRSLLALTPEEAASAIMRARDDGKAETEAQLSVVANDSPLPTATPSERLDDIVALMGSRLETELLEEVRKLPAASFERLIVRVLEAMDYGSASLKQGGAGDEGVDGVVDEDELGLGRIYVQAKRYKEGNAVGPAAIREFVGALTNAGASKGVFVTSSTFTKASHDALPRGSSAARIALIDGQRLVKLMIRHDIGVRTTQVIHVKDVDQRDLDPDTAET